jgi:hypothetical protein
VHNISELVKAHKQALLTSGKLSDFHIANLRKFPVIGFKELGLEKADIYFDFLKNEAVYAGVITYDLAFKKGTKLTKEEAKAAKDTVSAWVKSLFWAETEVKFKRKGKQWK